MIEVLIAVYILSLVGWIFFCWQDSKTKSYSNGDMILVLIIGIVPIINILAVLVGIIDATHKKNESWMNKQFKWSRK